MPLEVERSPQAMADLFDTYDYIREHSRSGAETTLRQIDAVVQMLAERPDAGRDQSNLRPGLRSFPAGSFMLFYRHDEATLTILRVMHGARNVASDNFEI